MKLGFASDHRGYALKKRLIEYYEKNGYQILDCGTNSSESCDYPDFAYQLGQKITNKDVNYGVAICGSGIGISIALNKIKGVYCARVSNSKEANYTRLDNDTNCIAFSETIPFEEAVQIVNTFINTEFSNLEKHLKRIQKVKAIENGEFYG